MKYDEQSELNLKLIIALTRSLQHIRKEEWQNISDANLTLSQFAVLEMLYHKGDLRICEIIEKTLSTGGNMTVVVANLEKEHLVHRRKDPDDGRAHVIGLTDQGYDLISKLFPVHINTVDNIFTVLDTDEKTTLLALLKKVTSRK